MNESAAQKQCDKRLESAKISTGKQNRSAKQPHNNFGQPLLQNGAPAEETLCQVCSEVPFCPRRHHGTLQPHTGRVSNAAANL